MFKLGRPAQRLCSGFEKSNKGAAARRRLRIELLEARRLLATDWELLGPEIDGVAAGDWFGNTTSLSADGRILAIGAPFHDNGGSDAGHTLVYQYVTGDNQWQTLGTEIVGEAGDQSGTSVSISMDGQSVAIGAPFNDGVSGTDSGTVRVYDYNSTDSAWVQRGNDIDGEAVDDRSGTSVSLSADGNTVAIGAPLNNNEEGVDAGHTRIHRYDSSSNTWKQIGQDLDGEEEDDEFGTAVSLSANGNRVAIGAPKNAGNGSLSGHVRVYQYDVDTDQWVRLGLDINGEGFIDMSGAAVSLSGDGSTVAIGAILNSNNGKATNAGHARAFRYIAGTWEQLGADIDGEAEGDLAGASVALTPEGNRIAVGSWGNNGAQGADSGHVRVFDYRDTDNSWIQVGTDIDGAASGDESGSSVAFSDDGNTISIGAISNLGNGNDTNGSGHTRVYHFADGSNSNNPPTLDAISALTIDEDATEQTVNLAGITAGPNESQSLRVTGTSDNTGLILDPIVSYTSANSTGTLAFTPVADQYGTATITVTVEDAGLDNDLATTGDNATFSRTFEVTVDPINDDPTLESLSNLTIDEDATEQTVNLAGISAGGEEEQPLRVTSISSDTNLMPGPTVTYTSAEVTGSLKFTPLADQSGTATITVTVEDGGLDGNLSTAGDNATFNRTFEVLVNPVNDDPTLDSVSNLTIDEDAAEQTVNLAGISAGPSESQHLKVLASSSDTNLIANPAVTYTSAEATGSLKFTPEADQSGTATITVTVEDGGLDNDLATAGDNATFSRTFEVTVNPINDDPTLDSLSNLTIDEDATEQTVNLAGISSGGGEEEQPLRVTSISSDPNLIPKPTVTFSSAEATGSLRFIPVADQTGAATITVTVEDGGLDGNLSTAGDNATVSQTFEVTVNAVNDVPTIDLVGDIGLDMNSAQQSLSLSGIFAGGGENQDMKVTASSSDDAVVAITEVNYTSAQATGQLVITAQPEITGVSLITVRVEDGGFDNDLSTTDDNATVETSFEVSVGLSSFVHSGDTLVSFVRRADQTLSVSSTENTLTLELSQGVWFGDDTAAASGNGESSLVVADRTLSRYELTGKPNQNLGFNQPQSWRMADWDPKTAPDFRPIESADDATRVIYLDWGQPWQNLLQHSDINNDGVITALDALQIINELGRGQYVDQDSGLLLAPESLDVWPGVYYDQNGDGNATALDALRVINSLARINQGGSGEGEWLPIDQALIKQTNRSDSQSRWLDGRELLWLCEDEIIDFEAYKKASGDKSGGRYADDLVFQYAGKQQVDAVDELLSDDSDWLRV